MPFSVVLHNMDNGAALLELRQSFIMPDARPGCITQILDLPESAAKPITCIIMEFARDIPLHLFVIKFEPRPDGLSKKLLA